MLKRFAIGFFFLLGIVNFCAAQSTPAASAAALRTPAEIFAVAAEQSDIRAEGSPPFRLKATFTVTGLDGKSTSGEYSEVWISKDGWQREISYGSYKEARSCVSGTNYTLVPETRIDFSVADMIANISPRIPNAKDPDDTNRRWSLKSEKLSEVPVLKVISTTPIKEKGGTPEAYYFTPSEGYPLGKTSWIESIVYRKFHVVFGKIVPYEVVSHYVASKRSVDLSITSIEKTTNPADDSLVIPGALKEAPTAKLSGGNAAISSGVIQGLVVSKFEPVFPELARRAGGGIVVVHITIGKDGKVKDVQVVSSPRPDLSDSAVTAVKQYVYRPFLLDGVPVEVEGSITVNYFVRR